ncbi:hypothetical protein HHK36_015230 [Tetracentron sinense]|uniref:Glycosyltransferase family 92 protein n=1 Tax=Tetracentron sinense TaxID=13715 RepID=A0A834Z2P3_TETSI|nr:hypothetical protein HHK36_015230 [Tetracentron sinense]
MASKHRRKRKPTLSSLSHCFSLRSLIFCFSCFVLVFFFSDGFSFGSTAFRPVLRVSRLSFLSAINSVQDSGNGSLPLRVEDRVLFPDHVLLLLSNSNPSLLNLHQNGGLDCVYHGFLNNSDMVGENRSRILLQPVLSVDEYDESRSIARCPIPPGNCSAVVSLREHGRELQDGDEGLLVMDGAVHSWEMVVYGAALDGDKVAVFVKGLNLRPDRDSDPTQFSCHFGWGNLEKGGSKFALTVKASTAAQEVVRCSLPHSIRKNLAKARGIRVTIRVSSHGNGNATSQAVSGGGGSTGGRTAPLHLPLPSVAKIFYANSQEKKNKKKYELCVCTMVWNQASSLREWIVYHSWLGVQRWFIYDNNSNDNIREAIDELEQEDYNVSRHVWPWIKTQEAGFSHCALKARDECKWVAFMDVDEFFYFPVSNSRRKRISGLGYPGQNSLRSLVAKLSFSTIGEIRTACHSFGPSGLSSPPSQGLMVGYTCRLQSPERHKSIVRLDALKDSLLNVVHHFRLRKGYKYRNVPQSIAVINHYKYQVWEAFRTKFFRRVATYVADWQENQNEGSKDRAPGLGTEAIEPLNWPLQFCEIWDTGLRDFVVANLADPASGLLPWERYLL